jgi:membrane protein implicated in regulation of membrane protease activity
MKSKLQQASATLVTVGILTSACENLTPGENAAVFGTAAGLATGIPLVASGVNPNIAIPVTAGAVAAAAVGAYIIAKHQASERQRKIAEQRARLYIARQEAARKAAASQPSSAKKKVSKPRYIAVKTVKEQNSKGKDQVMIFDTQSNEIVGDNVYDLKTTPQVGQTSKFDTYTAEYVGTGS